MSTTDSFICAKCGEKIQCVDKGYTCPICSSCFCKKCSNNFQEQILCPYCQLKQSQHTKLTASTNRVSQIIPDISQLAHVRVIQRNLVYIVGLPISLAHDDILMKYEYFGQYGPIKKIVVNSSHIHSAREAKETSLSSLSVTTYVTFRNPSDALECIYALDGFTIDGVQIKASFGTTKYCSSFLKGQRCNNPDCMYLHYCGEQSESFSKDEITGSSSRFIETTRPSLPPEYSTAPKMNLRATVFPPKRITDSLSPIKPDPKTMKATLANPQPLKGVPIIVDDPSTVSLNTQLRIFGPSPRSIYYSMLYNQQIF